MAGNDTGKMRKQKGMALALTLMALAVGSLLIIPTLNFVYSGTINTRIAEEYTLEQYTAEAAAEFALWQLKYNVDDITDLLDMDNPSHEDSVVINGIEIPIITEVSFSPESDDGSFTTPGTTSGIHIAAALEIRPSSWCKAGQKNYLTHIVYIYNYGTSAVHLKGLFQRFDPALKYVQDSYDGPSASVTKSLVGECWEISCDFDNPLPTLHSGEIMTITFITWAKKDMGDHVFNSEGWVSYAAFQEEEVECFSGESGVASFGLYDICTTVGSQTLLINVGVTEEGELVIRSYQFQ